MFDNPLACEKPLVGTRRFPTRDDYRRQALFQHEVLFWVSLIGGHLAFWLGLVPILYQFWMYPFLPLKTSLGCTFLETVLELVSRSLFRQKRELGRIVTAHYEQIVEDEHLQEAERITLSIEDDNLRDQEKRNLVRSHTRLMLR